MLRTVQSLPRAGPLTLGFAPVRFQTEPPVCYRASWQLPGPDFHRQATTSTNTTITPSPHEVTPCSALLCWAHESLGLVEGGPPGALQYVEGEHSSPSPSTPCSG